MLLAWAFMGEWTANHDLGRQVEAKVAEADALQKEYDETASRMDQLAGSAVAEREARLKLNMQRPDEEVYVVRGLEATAVSEASVVAAAAAVPATPSGNAVTWWHYFFK